MSISATYNECLDTVLLVLQKYTPMPQITFCYVYSDSKQILPNHPIHGLIFYTPAGFHPLLLFSFAVRQFFPTGIEKLRSVLLPAAPGITQHALDAFMSDLRSGESLGNSFTAFCTYIIDHDEILSG